MLIISNKKFFCKIVADAVIQAHLSCRRKTKRDRWIKAIARAAAVILEGDTTFLHFDSNTNILYYWSPESNEIYQSGKTCQCSAFNQTVPQPCYHRAMSRLIKNYFDFLPRPEEVAKIDFSDAVFFDSELTVKEKIELLNLYLLEGRTELEPRIRALQKRLTKKVCENFNEK